MTVPSTSTVLTVPPVAMTGEEVTSELFSEKVLPSVARTTRWWVVSVPTRPVRSWEVVSPAVSKV